MKIVNIKREFRTTALAESESVPGAFYKLTFEHGRFLCTCPSYVKTGVECKHILSFKEELEYLRTQREEQ